MVIVAPGQQAADADEDGNVADGEAIEQINGTPSEWKGEEQPSAAFLCGHRHAGSVRQSYAAHAVCKFFVQSLVSACAALRAFAGLQQQGSRRLHPQKLMLTVQLCLLTRAGESAEWVVSKGMLSAYSALKRRKRPAIGTAHQHLSCSICFMVCGSPSVLL